MKIQKEANITVYGTPDSAQLAKLNAFAPSPLTAEQVFVFSLRLCDDRVDRDFERFDAAALPKLAELFIGKTGVVDHRWSADCQVARIFDATVLSEDGVSYIKAWAYALRAGNEAFVRDVEGGIKKEVSVGCGMGMSRCSICGERYGSCQHEKGREYGGSLCVAVLSEPTDAYEFSFVAVPAQRQAGVIKGWKGGESMTLKELAERGGEQAMKDLAALEKEAALGRAYGKQLRQEVIRLSIALGLDAKEDVMRSAVEKLDVTELSQLQKALSDKAAAKYGLVTQLPADADRQQKTLDTDYLI